MLIPALTPEYEERLLERMRSVMPKEARWRYFQKGRGPMFIWTVEPFNLTDPSRQGQGMFESVVYVPIGKGSRTGKATNWKRDESTASLHALRRDAKARALRLFEEWKQNI